MAQQLRIKFNLRGINALMTSGEAQAEVDAAGRRMAARAGKNFEYVHSRKKHPWVARGYVQAKNDAGRAEEAVSKRLTRAVGNGK